MDKDLDEALGLFTTDCTARLDELEAALLVLERQPDERGVLDAMFRAVHTIKGNATVVQQGRIERFAHLLERVLERLRDGGVLPDGALISVLLACVDHLRCLIGRGCCAAPELMATDNLRMIGRLTPYLADTDLPALPRPIEAVAASGCWQLRVHFAPGLLRQGMDPLDFLRHLGSIGRIVSLQTFADGLPAWPDYDPELCYLDFAVALDTPAERQVIEDVFALVRDECEVQLTPPVKCVHHYVGRIQALPDDELQTGEMLMRVGALTPAELDDGLRQQRVADGGRPLGSILVADGVVAPEVVDAVLLRQDQIKQEVLRESGLLRVAPEQIDQLLSSLAGVQGSLAELARRGTRVSSVEMLALQHGLEKTRRLAEKLRTTRFGELFRRLHRVVRDTSLKLNKRADLLVSGGDLLLDRAVAELLNEALLHLLHNAIDHGLEAPDKRLQAGKLAQGTLRVTARADSGWLVFTVSDDGAGIDLSRVRATAVARGLLAADLEALPETLHALLFTPGFSTATEVTHYSGRGVGLDAVQDAVMALNGSIRLSSQAGIGTCVEIRLPLEPAAVAAPAMPSVVA